MSLIHIFKNQCPNCKKGNVFINSNLFSFMRLTEMNQKCPNCNYNFFPENGFYWGAMFVSYGLASLEGLLVILACVWYGNELFDYVNLLIIISFMIILFPLNFRLSRIIWLYIFGNKIKQ
jgi:ribosomal protein S27AE